MRVKIISFGKKIENLRLAIRNQKLGSDQSTFGERIKASDIVLLMCHSKVFGTAIVKSSVYQEDKRIWRDKIYPHRADLEQIKIFKDAFSFEDLDLNSLLREKLGKGWAFKVIFTPGDLPIDVENIILKEINSREFIDQDNFDSQLEMAENEYIKKRKERLGLKV